MIIFSETTLLVRFTVLFSLIGFYVDFETVHLECLVNFLFRIIYNCLAAFLFYPEILT